jgi:hypothetical protein
MQSDALKRAARGRTRRRDGSEGCRTSVVSDRKIHVNAEFSCVSNRKFLRRPMAADVSKFLIRIKHLLKCCDAQHNA